MNRFTHHMVWIQLQHAMNAARYKIATLATLLLLGQLTSFAQKDPLAQLAKMATLLSTPGWFSFDKGIVVTANNLQQQLQSNGVISNELRLIQSKVEVDALGQVHTWMKQTYKGYPVEFGEFVLHEAALKPALGVGELALDLQQASTVSISFEKALAIALQRFPSKTYGWQIKAEEDALRNRTNGQLKTYYPEKKIVWLPARFIEKGKAANMNYRLAYKITVTAFNPDFTVDVYVDAVNGALLKHLKRECTFDVSFNSNFNGVQTAVTTFVGTDGIITYNNYQLIRPVFGSNTIYTSNNANFYTPISNTVNVWADNIENNSAFSSQWATAYTGSYFNTVHGRNGFEGAGIFRIDQRQNSSFVNPAGATYFANASFNATGIMKVGNNESAGPLGVNSYAQDDWNSLDILAHEFTHGITFNSADLIYEKEPGALNESFSDIFGATVYAYYQGLFYSNNVWLVGYDRRKANNHLLSDYIRNMSNPNELDDPDTYGAGPWIDVTTATDPGDFWGVHENSGVQNFMYYLLVRGGSGVNDFNTSYNVTGIGFVKARAIAYRALTQGYLTSGSGFIQSRAAWIRSAEDLYGVCSTEAIAVANAWKAVGLGRSSNPAFLLCGTYGGSSYTYTYFGTINAAFNCPVTINPASPVDFTAGRAVVLNPGFTAAAGSYFNASINDACFETSY